MRESLNKFIPHLSENIPAKTYDHWVMALIVAIVMGAGIGSEATNNSYALTQTPGQYVSSAHSNTPFAITLPDRAKAAALVVSGRVSSAVSSYQTNSYGDNLIYTRAIINIDDVLKGSAGSALEVLMVGGTVDGITMRSSKADEPLRRGENAVLFLENISGKWNVVVGEDNILRRGASGDISYNGVKISFDEFRQIVMNAK